MAETAADKVRNLLEAQPDLSTDHLAKATGYSERTVRQALKKLDAEFSTGPHGSKVWRLPEAQRSA